MLLLFLFESNFNTLCPLFPIAELWNIYLVFGLICIIFYLLFDFDFILVCFINLTYELFVFILEKF
jgi:hypothetical protein